MFESKLNKGKANGYTPLNNLGKIDSKYLNEVSVLTGGTYENGSISFYDESGQAFVVNGLYTGSTDVFVTSGVYSNGVTTFTNSTGGTFSVTGYFTGSTDVFVTGGTYNNTTGVITFTNNTGGTFSVTGIVSSSLRWYAENSTPPTVAPIATGFGSIALGDSTQALSYNMFVYGNSSGLGATSANYSNFLGYFAGYAATSANNSNFLGSGAGLSAINASNSNFMGKNAGYGATRANYSNFLGSGAGNGASNASNSNFMGQNAGYGATSANYSNFLGSGAGYGASNAGYSNFMGQNAGYGATSANNSNFLGNFAGNGASNASYSNFMGQNAGNGKASASYSNLLGYNVAGNGAPSINSNNIIIGTNISLPENSSNKINLGGVLFGSNTYFNPGFTVSLSAQIEGKIGIGVVEPTAKLHVAASTTLSAALRLTVGPAPTSPNDGDIWLESNTDTGLKIRINGVTRTITLT